MSASGDFAQDELPPFAGGHHARFIHEGVPLHIISRIFQGRHLLRPGKTLNALIVGLIAHARALFPDVKLYAVAVMSNHVHMMVQGACGEVPAFVGFIKREISRRWGAHPSVNWPGTMWHEYLASALPTRESQLHCLKYILSQGAKEHLVERPQDWPGVHVAKSFVSGTKLRGFYFDATSYGRACENAKRKHRAKVVRRADYLHRCELSFDPLPAWAHLNESDRRVHEQGLVIEVTRECQVKRLEEGATVVGAELVKQTPLERISKLPSLPWFEHRRRMICWADRRDSDVKRYLAEYWSFQRSYTQASQRFCSGEMDVPFPPRAFRPGTHVGPPAAGVSSLA